MKESIVCTLEKPGSWIGYALMMLAGSLILLLSQNAQAGGIALGATRVIYPQGQKQVSLPITNSDDKGVFLIQTWVASADGSKSNDFVVTPPLFVSQPKKENILRIMYVGGQLPTDREAVYYLNSKAIPSVDKSGLNGNTLQIATQSVIKLFMRPKALPTTSDEAPGTLRCQADAGGIKITNPSPYYVSLVQLYVNGNKLPNNMVPPKGYQVIDTAVQKGTVTFQTVNDFGANTAKQTCIWQ